MGPIIESLSMGLMGALTDASLADNSDLQDGADAILSGVFVGLLLGEWSREEAEQVRNIHFNSGFIDDLSTVYGVSITDYDLAAQAQAALEAVYD